MTRKDAIEYFNRCYAIGNSDDARQHDEAINIAIKSLEAWDKVKNDLHLSSLELHSLEFKKGLEHCEWIIEKHLKEVGNDIS